MTSQGIPPATGGKWGKRAFLKMCGVFGRFKSHIHAKFDLDKGALWTPRFGTYLSM